MLPGHGRLEVRVDESRVLFHAEHGDVHDFERHPIFSDPGRFTHVAARDGRSAVIARDESDRLYVFDAERMLFRSVPGFDRLRHAEALDLHALEDGYLIVTENGVANIDSCGRTRWRIDAVTLGWRLLAAADGALWMRDASGDVFAYEAETGHELVG